MRRPKTKVIVKLVKLEVEDKWGIPYLGMIGEVIKIDKGAFTEYELGVRFDEQIDIKVFGEVLENGFRTNTREIEVLEGNLHTAYYGDFGFEF